MKKVKLKKCKTCKEPFVPQRPLQACCSPGCAYEYSKKLLWKEKKKKIKEKLKDHSYYVNQLQKHFNAFIRERDKNKPCICCDKPLGEVYHAGHLFSVGAFPALRFDEDNCHAQRTDCNLHKHGNGSEYAIKLPKRIGQERFNSLYNRRSLVTKLSIPELKEKIQYYKSQTLKLKNENTNL